MAPDPSLGYTDYAEEMHPASPAADYGLRDGFDPTRYDFYAPARRIGHDGLAPRTTLYVTSGPRQRSMLTSRPMTGTLQTHLKVTGSRLLHNQYPMREQLQSRCLL